MIQRKTLLRAEVSVLWLGLHRMSCVESLTFVLDQDLFSSTATM